MYNYTFDTAGEWYVEYTCTNSSGGEETLFTENIAIQQADMDTIFDMNITLSALENTNLSEINGNLTLILNNQAEINTTINYINTTANNIETTTNYINGTTVATNTTANNIYALAIELNGTLTTLSADLLAVNQTIEDIYNNVSAIYMWSSDTFTNVRTIIWYMWNLWHYDNWVDFTPRVATGVSSAVNVTNPANATEIADCVWNKEGSNCTNFKEIDNRRE